MSPYRSSTSERTPPQPAIPIAPPATSAEVPAPATWAAQYAHALPTLIAALGGATSLSIRVPPPGSTDAMELTWTLARSAADRDTMSAELAQAVGRESPSPSPSAASSSSSLVSLLLTSPSSPSIGPSPTSRIQGLGLGHALSDESERQGSDPSRRRASHTAQTPLRRQPPRERRLPLRLQETDTIEAMGNILPRFTVRAARGSRTFGRAKPGAREKRGRRGRQRK